MRLAITVPVAALVALALCANALAAPAPPSHVGLQVDTLGIDLAYVFDWDNPNATLPAVELSVDGAPFAAVPTASAGLAGVPGGVVLQDSLTHLSTPGAHTLQVRFVGADGTVSAPAAYRWSNATKLKLRVKRVRRGVYRLVSRTKGDTYRWELSGQTVCRTAQCRVRVSRGWHKLRVTVIDGPATVVRTESLEGR